MCWNILPRSFFLGKEYWHLAEQDCAPIARRKALHYLPSVIDTARVENINLSGPLKRVLQALTNDIGLVANGKKTQELHLKNAWVCRDRKQLAAALYDREQPEEKRGYTQVGKTKQFWMPG